MNVLTLILMVFAFVCFVVASLAPPVPPRPVWGWLGLAFWVLAIILGGGRTLVG
jgi:hypothetical protein